MEKRKPLSLEDLKKRREEQVQRDSRPVFLSEEQRQHASRIAFLEKRAEERALRGKKFHTSTVTNSISESSHAHEQNESQSGDSRLHSSERAAIHSQYMKPYSERSQANTSRGNDRNRFRFEWDASDDTMREEDDVRLAIRRKIEKESLHQGRSRTGAIDSLGLPVSKRRSKAEESLSSKKRARKYDGRHWSDKSREEMTERDWRIFREDFLISVRGAGADQPARNWAETRLPQNILDLVSGVAKYNKPSPIQMASIPICLQVRDVIGLAETGSGKTASYVLPMLVHIEHLPRINAETAAHGPYALVLAPTRELALQIDAESRKFCNPLGIRVVTIIGGQGLEEQATRLHSGCEITICTPGRMVDLISRRMAALGNCNFLVLDEADRMVDMGFEPQVQEILAAMPDQFSSEEIPEKESEGLEDRKVLSRKKRQTLMFSATMSPAVERLARSYLSEPVIVTIGETGQAADNVVQVVEYFENDGRKRDRLLDLLETLEAPILVFANTKSGCETTSRFIESASGIRTAVMHAGKSQETREKTLEGFKSGRFRVLIATDLVARGIDVKGVKNVVNFELPKRIETYTHRIGRTGRAGEKGTSYALATPVDEDLFPALRQLLEKAGAKIPAQIAKYDMFSAGSSRRNGRHGYGKPIID